MARQYWIDRKNIPLSGRLGDNLDPNACKKGPRYVPPRYFARLMNCDNCSDGTEVKVLNRPGDNHWPIYRNVHPGTREHRHDLVARLRANALVRWRYISRSGRFVLITVRRASDGSEPQLASGSLGGARWGFISRDALPRAFGPGGLCADRTHGIMATGERQNPNLNPRPDRYVTKDGKRIPLWPPVCKRDGPGAD